MAQVIPLDSITEKDVARTAAALEGGGLVCLPSDTVYGLACLPDRPEAVERLYRLKGREAEKPLALVFTSVPRICEVVSGIPEVIRRALDRLMPGPLTAILPLPAPLGRRQFHGTGSVGVRIIPPPAGDLYGRLPGPLAVTSANLSGLPDPVSATEIPREITEACDFVIDAGRCRHGVPSTIVDLRPLAEGAPARILRKGPLPVDRIAELIGPVEE